MAEYVFSRVSPIFGYHQHGDSNGEHPNKCPEYGRGLFITNVVVQNRWYYCVHWEKLTSIKGSQRFPKEETALQSRVTATNMRKP